MRIALGLEYNGSRFCGWQTQPSACAVQDALEQALAEIGGGPIKVTAAGRTDTGVHARAQVVHFDACEARPVSAWVRGVNALLPPAVAVQWAQAVAPEFNARFSALARSYRYVLLNRATRPGLHAGQVGWYHAPLNLPAMQEAAAILVGEHDFSAFRSAECQAKTPVRNLRQLTLTRWQDYVIFDLQANAFLHHMVRNIVGCLVAIGKGKYSVGWMREVLLGRDRRLAAATFASDGLYLSAVEYAPHWGLPPIAHAAQTLPLEATLWSE